LAYKIEIPQEVLLLSVKIQRKTNCLLLGCYACGWTGLSPSRLLHLTSRDITCL